MLRGWSYSPLIPSVGLVKAGPLAVPKRFRSPAEEGMLQAATIHAVLRKAPLVNAPIQRLLLSNVDSLFAWFLCTQVDSRPTQGRLSGIKAEAFSLKHSILFPSNIRMLATRTRTALANSGLACCWRQKAQK